MEDTRLTCLEGVKPRPVWWVHLGGVGPRTHVWENHNPFDGQTIQSWCFFFLLFFSMCQTWCAAQETIRGEHSDQPLTRWCAPGISWWRAPVKMRNAPREKKTVTTKVEGRKEKKGRLTLWSSLNVPTCTRVMILCVLQAICPESKTRGETAAPWRPDARRKQLCQQRRGWLRACADYRLPPPGFANNEAEHHRAAQPTTCRAPRSAADKQVRSVFTL